MPEEDPPTLVEPFNSKADGPEPPVPASTKRTLPVTGAGVPPLRHRSSVFESRSAAELTPRSTPTAFMPKPYPLRLRSAPGYCARAKALFFGGSSSSSSPGGSSRGASGRRVGVTGASVTPSPDEKPEVAPDNSFFTKHLNHGGGGGEASPPNSPAGLTLRKATLHRLAPRRLKDSTFLVELFSKSDLKHVILPFGRFRTYWDLLILLLVVYTALSLPIVLAYPDADATFDAVRELELLMDVLFMIDIGINFRTAYVVDAELIVSRSMIVRRYLSRWFAIDFAASIPWEIIFRIIEASGGTALRSAAGGGSAADAADSDVQIVTLVKLLKVPKLLRLGRLLRFLERIEGAANVGRIFILMMIMGVIVHWVRFVRRPARCARLRVRACVRACVPTCVRACVRARFSVNNRA